MRLVSIVRVEEAVETKFISVFEVKTIAGLCKMGNIPNGKNVGSNRYVLILSILHPERHADKQKTPERHPPDAV